MKLNLVVLGGLLCLCSTVFATDNQHINPQTANTYDPSAAEKASKCQIVVYNDTFGTLSVFGVYDNGSTLQFKVPWHYSNRISLHYDGSCHSGMHLEIYSSAHYGMCVYSGYARKNEMIKIDDPTENPFPDY